MDPEAEAVALVTSAGVCILEGERVIRVSGDDALTWLQGQVTQDVLGLREGEGAFALILAPTGKIQSDVWVHRRAEDVILVVPATNAEALVAHLDAHVIMEDVALELDPGLAVVTVQGPAARTLRAARHDGLDADRLDTGAGFDVLAKGADAAALADALADAARAIGGSGVGADGYELARVRRGVPKLGADFGESTLPQEAGLAGRAVSFSKGCYLGQEPVVMLEHRGQPPKRLFVVRSGGAVAAGDALATAEGAAAGRITSVAPRAEADGAVLGLALVKRVHAVEGATLRCGDVQVTLVRPVGAPRVAAGDVP